MAGEIWGRPTLTSGDSSERVKRESKRRAAAGQLAHSPDAALHIFLQLPWLP